MKVLATLLLLAASALGQSAVVVPLEPETASEAKRLYDAKQAADLAWYKFYLRIEQAHKGEPFQTGIEFSQDFNFIVPKAAEVYASSGNGTITWGGYPSCYASPTFTLPDRTFHSYVTPDGAEFSSGGSIIINAIP